MNQSQDSRDSETRVIENGFEGNYNQEPALPEGVTQYTYVHGRGPGVTWSQLAYSEQVDNTLPPGWIPAGGLHTSMVETISSVNNNSENNSRAGTGSLVQPAIGLPQHSTVSRSPTRTSIVLDARWDPHEGLHQVGQPWVVQGHGHLHQYLDLAQTQQSLGLGVLHVSSPRPVVGDNKTPNS